jgi:hypothetical protein
VASWPTTSNLGLTDGTRQMLQTCSGSPIS